MSQLQHARSFRDLIVYQKTRVVTKRVFDISKGFPKKKMYSLTDQVRRSSRSIGAQIAEAWSKRRYEKHFVSKLTDADVNKQFTAGIHGYNLLGLIDEHLNDRFIVFSSSAQEDAVAVMFTLSAKL
jgi:hypothetical protein